MAAPDPVFRIAPLLVSVTAVVVAAIWTVAAFEAERIVPVLLQVFP